MFKMEENKENGNICHGLFCTFISTSVCDAFVKVNWNIWTVDAFVTKSYWMFDKWVLCTQRSVTGSNNRKWKITNMRTEVDKGGPPQCNVARGGCALLHKPCFQAASLNAWLYCALPEKNHWRVGIADQNFFTRVYKVGRKNI